MHDFKPFQENLKNHLRKVENMIMEDAFRYCRFNITKASKYLGINRTTLIEKTKHKRFPRRLLVSIMKHNTVAYNARIRYETKQTPEKESIQKVL